MSLKLQNISAIAALEATQNIHGNVSHTVVAIITLRILHNAVGCFVGVGVCG